MKSRSLKKELKRWNPNDLDNRTRNRHPAKKMCIHRKKRIKDFEHAAIHIGHNAGIETSAGGFRFENQNH